MGVVSGVGAGGVFQPRSFQALQRAIPPAAAAQSCRRTSQHGRALEENRTMPRTKVGQQFSTDDAGFGALAGRVRGETTSKKVARPI